MRTIREKGLTYCRPEMKNRGKAARTSKKYCPVCKRKIRGKNHAEGDYHKLKVAEQKLLATA